LSQGEDLQRQMEKGRVERRRAILNQALNEAWSRELLYWIAFEVAGLSDVVTSFEKVMSIKDGHAAAMHQAFFDGRKSVGGAIAAECLEVQPEAWARMVRERNEQAEQFLHKWNEAQKQRAQEG
jgi:hypothetical protein